MFALLAHTSPASAANPTGPTTTTITAAPATSGFGTSVTFTVAVTLTSNGTAVTSGTVKLMDGATQIGSTTTVDGTTGKATFTTSTLSVATHNLTATYTDPANMHNSSGTLSYNVLAFAVMTDSVSPSGSAAVGQNVTITFTVKAPATNLPVTTGSIKVFDNLTGATLASALTLNVSGQATYSSTTLVTGTHPITAQWSDSLGNTSQLNFNIVVAASSTTVLATSLSPSVFGNSVTLTATVTSPGGTPTGQITFSEGGTTIGSTSLDGSGVGRLVTSALAGGTHSIIASYATGNFANSTSSTLTQVVNPAASATTITTPAASVVGANVALTATVTSTAGVPGGSVTFTDGPTTLGAATLASGTATLNTTALGAGSHTIVATYTGSTNFATSNGSTTAFNISAATTTTAVTASPANATLGGSVSFIATVTASSGGSPTGTVTFSEGGTTLATAGLSGGQATGSTTALTVGSHSVIATYGGSSNDAASVSATAASVTVAPATTTLSLTAAPSPGTAGQTSVLTAVVLPSAGSTPTGSVAFTDGGNSLGAAVTLDASGQATINDPSLSVGTHNLSATYTGSGPAAGSTSTGTASLTVARGTTSIAIVGTPNPAAAAANVVLQATVNTTGGFTPGGTVTFKDGSTTLGSPTLVAGVASVSTSALIAGSHTITVTYAGDTNNLGSTGTLTQSIGNGSSSTVIAGPVTAAPGQSVTFTVTVTGAGTSPAGLVSLQDNGSTIATNNLTSGQAQFTTTFTAGPHSIAVVYAGGGGTTGSTSNTISLSVVKVATTTSVTASANPAIIGSPVTFTATVTGSADSPTQSVNFFDGATNIGSGSVSGGHASFTTSSLGGGGHTITAQYIGDGENQGSTSLAYSLTETTGASADFSLSTTISGVTMGAGQNTTLPLTLQGSNGFSGTVTITCVGLPQGATCVSSPSTVAVGGAPVNVSVVLSTTGGHSGSVAPMSAGRLRRAAIPLAGVFALLAFMRRRKFRVVLLAGFLALSSLVACGGGGGGSTLPSTNNGNGFGGVGPGVSVPTPVAVGTPGATPAPGSTPQPAGVGGTTIVAGTGQPGSVSTNTNPQGAVPPGNLPAGTVVPGTLSPGTSSGPAGQTPAGTSTVALVATGSNGVAHPLNITVVITP